LLTAEDIEEVMSKFKRLETLKKVVVPPKGAGAAAAQGAAIAARRGVSILIDEVALVSSVVDWGGHS
jgi:hypothetical protein